MAKGPAGRPVEYATVRVAPDTSGFGEQLKAQVAKETRGIVVKIPVEIENAALEKFMSKLTASTGQAKADMVDMFDSGMLRSAAQKVESISKSLRDANSDSGVFSGDLGPEIQKLEKGGKAAKELRDQLDKIFGMNSRGGLQAAMKKEAAALAARAKAINDNNTAFERQLAKEEVARERARKQLEKDVDRANKLFEGRLRAENQARERAFAKAERLQAIENRRVAQEASRQAAAVAKAAEDQRREIDRHNREVAKKIEFERNLRDKAREEERQSIIKHNREVAKLNDQIQKSAESVRKQSDKATEDLNKERAKNELEIVRATAKLAKEWAKTRDEMAKSEKLSYRLKNNIGSMVRPIAKVSRATRDLPDNMKKFGDEVRKTRTGQVLGAGVKSVKALSVGALRASTSFTKLGRAGAITFAVISLAAPAVGAVSGLLAGLPSLGFAAAAGIAAIALGFDGIKKAASQLGPEVDSLKKRLSDTFEKGMEPVFKKLEKVFPALERGLDQVALGVIDMSDAFVEVLTSKRGLEQIESILNNTGKFFKDLRPFVTNFTDAFLTLGDAGAKSFDILAGTLNRFAVGFNKVVQRVTNDGSFRAGMEGLAKITDGLFDAFNRVFEAGIRVLPTIGEPIGRLLSTIGTSIADLMPSLGNLTAAFANLFSDGLVAATPYIKNLFQGIADVINDPNFREGLRALGEGFGDVVSAVTTSLPDISAIFSGIFSTVGGVFSSIAPYIKPVIGAIRDGLIPILPKVQGLFKKLADTIGPILPDIANLGMSFLNMSVNVLGPLASILGALAPIFKIVLIPLTALFDAISFGIEKVSPLIDMSVQGWTLAFENLAKGTGMAAEYIANGFEVMDKNIKYPQKTWDDFSASITGNVSEIGFSLQDMVGGFNVAGTGVADALFGAAGSVAVFEATSKSKMEQFAEGVRGAFDRARGIIEAAKAPIGSAGSAMFGNFANGTAVGMAAAESNVRVGVARVTAALNGATGAAGNAGASLSLAFAAGIASQAALAAAQRAAARLTSSVRAYFPSSPAKKGPFSGRGWTPYSGIALVEGWAQGIEQATPKAVAAVDNLMSGSAGLSANVSATVNSGDFGTVGDAVERAMAGWTFKMDANGVWKMVKQVETGRARR